MNRALLIGNGPSALERDMGEVIDSDKFDAVVRINRWAFDEDGTPFKQFPKEVGTRCDYWIVNDLHLTETQIALKFGHLYKGVLVVAPKFKWNQIAKFVTRTSGQFPFISLIPAEYEDRVNRIVNFSPKWPTTGLVGILFFLSYYDEVSIYGFDSYDTKYENMHYFESSEAPYGKNKYRDSNKVDHTPSNDRLVINYLLENYNLKLL